MSAPAGLHHSQASLIARWMPSTARAGVILNPDLTESLRNSSTWRSQDVDDSFASQFAPLPTSTSSSCLSVDDILQAGCGKLAGKLSSRPEQTAWPDKQLAGLHPSRLNSLGDMDSMEESPDLPLMLKLEQLRQWQQQMQEQLKAHQLEELLYLQEEQQRLLAMVNVSQEGADPSNLSKPDWGENTLVSKKGSPTPQGHPTSHGSSLQHLPTHIWRQEEPRGSWGQEEEEEEEEENKAIETIQVVNAWSCKDGSQEQSVDEDLSKENDAMLGPPAGNFMNGDLCEGDDMEMHLEDRPIKPGVGGQKLTFEELLEEQLTLEEQRLKSTQLQQSQVLTGGASGPPRRTFLKRGEGLARFTSGRKAPVGNRAVKQDTKTQEPLVKVNARWASESKTFVNVQPTGCKRPPVQRKTAVLNKENRPKELGSPHHQDGRAEVKLAQPSTVRPKVPGGHHNINLVPTDPVQMYPEVRQTGLLKELSSGNEGNLAQHPNSQSVSWDGPSQVLTKRVSVVDRGNALRKKGNGSPPREDFVEGKPESEAVPEYSFEVSFQEKLKYWDHKKQAETAELGEFELLEQAADELSFSSNSSFVMKVLQMDQHYRRLQSSGGDQPRRLSSTPIKSPRPSPPKKDQSQGGKISRNISTESESVPLKSKRKTSHGEDGSDYDDENNHNAPDISFHSELEFEDQDVIAGPMLPPTFSTNNCFSASNLPYDKRSYQDQDGGHGSDQAEQQNVLSGDTSDIDSASDITSPDESTVTEDKEGRPDGVVFDDEDPWNDLKEADGLSNDTQRVSPAPMATTSKVTPPERSLTRKVAVAKGMERQRDRAISPANDEPDPPPTSQLMARLFPSLKPKSQSPPSVSPETRKTEETAGQQVQSKQLRERLVELELEIERFRTENAALAKLRQENERNQENLRKERAEFEQSRAEELARFEEYKKEETKKLQRERKVFEKHASAARAIPDKKERDEIQALKQQLTSMQEELKRRESRWSTTHVRLRQQIDTLSSDNSALKSEVNTLEKLRLAAWKKSQADAEREKENARDRREKEREWPKMFESTSAPVTKGVTFASPPIREVPPQSGTASTRLSPRDHSPSATVLTKSSLRRKSAPSPAFSVFPAPDRSPEEKNVSVARVQNTPPVNQDPSNNTSSMVDGLQTKAVLCKTQESNDDVVTYPDGKVESVLPCGGRLIVFPNGTRKEVSTDGDTAKVTFFNGDIKQVLADKRVIYYYADARTTHTTYPDGIEILQFPNNQTEKHFPDGRKEITFPDQTIKNLFPDGREESVLMDGTIIQVNKDGSKEIQFNTGQKEIHTADYKKREYPDGTVKTVYTDGRQETRYPNGRIRVKDKDGNIVMDNRP